jgi:hypothetical protein
MTSASRRQWDGVLLATVAGMLASLAKDVPNFILYRLGVHHVLYWRIAATTFVQPGDAGSVAGQIIGCAADIILGGTIGLIILQAFRIYGPDLWWYKGLVAGNAIWLFGSGFALNIFLRHIPSDPIFRLTSLLDHQLYGLVAAYLIWRWTKPGKEPPG